MKLFGECYVYDCCTICHPLAFAGPKHIYFEQYAVLYSLKKINKTIKRTACVISVEMSHFIPIVKLFSVSSMTKEGVLITKMNALTPIKYCTN